MCKMEPREGGLVCSKTEESSVGAKSRAGLQESGCRRGRRTLGIDDMCSLTETLRKPLGFILR